MLLQRHARDDCRPTLEPGARCLARRAGLRQRREARLLLAGRCRGEARADVHLIDISVAGTRRPTSARVSRFGQITVVGTSGHLRTGAASRYTAFVQHASGNAGGLPRLEHRQFRSAWRPTRCSGAIREPLARGDLLLLGADLVKPEQDLLLAYDDPLGVTAAFNRNLLVRINRELGADFDLAAFAHRAIWNVRERRVEMHLVSARDQQVYLAAADVRIAVCRRRIDLDGELVQVHARVAARSRDQRGFTVTDQWIDAEARFALTLFETD